MSDPLLKHYVVIIVDETHKRTVWTDVLLGLLKDIVRQRAELKVVIITSPHVSNILHTYFGEAPLIQVESKEDTEGPLKVVYSSMPQENYFLPALRLLFNIHNTREKGDVAMFLSCKKVSSLLFSTFLLKAKSRNGDEYTTGMAVKKQLLKTKISN